MADVTFIHGIGNKPAAGELMALWKGTLALRGLDLDTEGVSSRMVYWADLLYPEPLAEEIYEAVESPEVELPDVGLGWVGESGGERARFVAGLAAELGYAELATGAPEPEPAEAAVALERVPLPWPLKRRLMKVLLRDVEFYLFDEPFRPRAGETYRIQTEIRRRFVAALAEGAAEDGPHVVVSHSLGTVIAYDCLKRVDGCPGVDGLMTIGSPLGLDEIQDKLKPQWSRVDGYPERLSGSWVNVYDPLDPVAGFDRNLAGDFRRGGVDAILDVNEPNSGAWRHSIVKYLRGVRLHAELRKLLAL